MNSSLLVNFEIDGLALLRQVLAKLVKQGPPEAKFGYITLEYIHDFRLSLGTLPQTDVPYGNILKWDPITVLCCDDKVVEKNVVFVHCTGTVSNLHHAIYFDQVKDCKYVSYKYKWDRDWR